MQHKEFFIDTNKGPRDNENEEEQQYHHQDTLENHLLSARLLHVGDYNE